MAEHSSIPSKANKKTSYESLLPQLQALVEEETDLIANLSNLMAGLHHGMGFLWTGSYFVKGEELVLGPFQGPVACTRIQKGKGVCGTCWEEGRTVIVEDVEEFPGHIACSPDSRSEIVLPVFDQEGKVCMVLDIDSDQQGAFNEKDEYYLRQITALIEDKF